jgi:aromatic-L-amino-acid decarboxylase
MHRLVDEAMRRIVEHVQSLPSQPSANVEGAAEFARTLIEPVPETGARYEDLLDSLFRDMIPRSFNAAGPGYLAYIPGGGIFHAAIADLIADSVNRYVGVFAAAPALFFAAAGRLVVVFLAAMVSVNSLCIRGRAAGIVQSGALHHPAQVGERDAAV